MTKFDQLKVEMISCFLTQLSCFFFCVLQEMFILASTLFWKNNFMEQQRIILIDQIYVTDFTGLDHTNSSSHSNGICSRRRAFRTNMQCREIQRRRGRFLRASLMINNEIINLSNENAHQMAYFVLGEVFLSTADFWSQLLSFHGNNDSEFMFVR